MVITVHTWQPSPNGIRSVHASSLYLGNYVSPSKRNCPWCLEGASHRWAPQFLFRSWLVRVTGSLKRTRGTETVGSPGWLGAWCAAQRQEYTKISWVPPGQSTQDEVVLSDNDIVVANSDGGCTDSRVKRTTDPGALFENICPLIFIQNQSL